MYRMDKDRQINVGIHRVRRLLASLLAVVLVCGQLIWQAPIVSAAKVPTDIEGATYFVDTDNWGGGSETSAADHDLNESIKNQNKSTADNYSKYPVEFKIEDVDKLPTKSAQLLIRSYDVDEYNEPILNPANGEWDRVYFSSNPADIALGAAYTPWSTEETTWADKIKASKIGTNGQGYLKEIGAGAYLGSLSGKNEVSNTTVLSFKPEEFNRIALGDNYVGVTIHHYYQDKRSAGANTNWTMKVEWGQLVIDGGIRKTAEITDVGIEVEKGKVTFDTSFLPKLQNKNYTIEVNVIEKTTVGNENVERNLGLVQQYFDKPTQGEDKVWADKNKNVISDPNIDPSKEYVINVILFDNRTGGKIDPGEAQHVVSVSTHDPIVKDITKNGSSSQPTTFKAEDFSSKFLKVSGVDNSANLKEVEIVTVPKPADGKLILDGKEVTVGTEIEVAQLEKLQFVPATPESERLVTFKWNGSDGMKYAVEPATVTLNLVRTNTAPTVDSVRVNAYAGDPVSFQLASFEQSYRDAEQDTLASVQIDLPADFADKGQLRYNTDSTVTEVVYLRAGMMSELSATELSTLQFLPSPVLPANAVVSFNWLASDGELYSTTAAPVVIRYTSQPIADSFTITANEGVPSIAIDLSRNSDHTVTNITYSIEQQPAYGTLLADPTDPTHTRWVYTPDPSSVTAGEDHFTYTYTVVDQNGQTTAIPGTVTIVINKVVQAKLELVANPDKLLGDGQSTTVLSAKLTDSNGSPVQGVKVVFSVPAGVGTFIGATDAVTDANGLAQVTYRSAQITGINEQHIELLAQVNDPERRLFAQDEVKITFMPASIKGFITKNETNEPVVGADVTISYDVNGDGLIEQGVDFITMVKTDARGKYEVIVPKGDVKYNIEFKQQINIGGKLETIVYKQVARVGQVTGSGAESYNSDITATGLLLMKQPDGSQAFVSDTILSKLHVYVKKSAGTYVSENGSPKAFTLESNGLFHAEGLAVGKYELEFRYAIRSGNPITISRSKLDVTAAGQMNISATLVDPYGSVTDKVTKQVIQDAKVELYYANTPHNIASGIVPNSSVSLPYIQGFAPHHNASPVQLTDRNGLYAYMVYPNTDYYLVVSKAGYEKYTSPVIAVGLDIVEHNVELTPVSYSSSNNSIYVPDVTKVSLSITVDKNLVKEGEQSSITIAYKNDSNHMLATGELKVTLPDGVSVIDAAGGAVAGQVITWKVNQLAAGKVEKQNIVLQWPLKIKSVNEKFELKGLMTSAGVTSSSSAVVSVYSDRYGELKHVRYILGFPDQEFKANSSLTRAELAAIIARLTSNNISKDELHYKDVRKGHWATNYIKIVTMYGFFDGYKDGTFRPDAPVTRGELAMVMARFLKLETGSVAGSHFTDTKEHWAGDVIEALYNGKFLTGYQDNSFKPKNNITRVEAVTLINRMLYRGPLTGLAPQFPDIPTTHWGFGDIQEATVSHEAGRNSDSSESFKRKLPDDIK